MVLRHEISPLSWTETSKVTFLSLRQGLIARHYANDMLHGLNRGCRHWPIHWTLAESYLYKILKLNHFRRHVVFFQTCHLVNRWHPWILCRCFNNKVYSEIYALYWLKVTQCLFKQKMWTISWKIMKLLAGIFLASNLAFTTLWINIIAFCNETNKRYFRSYTVTEEWYNPAFVNSRGFSCSFQLTFSEQVNCLKTVLTSALQASILGLFGYPTTKSLRSTRFIVHGPGFYRRGW